jgi:hypothetical protein
MTREEQTKREAEVYGWTGSQFDIQAAFIKGAKWADETLLKKIEAYMIFADMKYINDPRNVNLRETIKDYMDEIVSLVVKINDLEVKVIHNDNESLMMKCECKKAKLINILTHFENKYL